MNKIYLIGDTHGTYAEVKKVFTKYELNQDYIIVLGDFGFIWNPKEAKHLLKQLEYLMTKFNSQLLFVDGNHENFELLSFYPVEEWNGGKIQVISPHVKHLMRGQVFEIEGKKFFTMGGADSIDKAYRTNRISWWEEENITYADLQEASKNLALHNDTVDYVLTHTCPLNVKHAMKMKIEFDNSNENKLQEIANTINFKHWYFGHYHIDWSFKNYTCVWKDVIPVVDLPNFDVEFDAKYAE